MPLFKYASVNGNLPRSTDENDNNCLEVACMCSCMGRISLQQSYDASLSSSKDETIFVVALRFENGSVVIPDPMTGTTIDYASRQRDQQRSNDNHAQNQHSSSTCQISTTNNTTLTNTEAQQHNNHSNHNEQLNSSSINNNNDTQQNYNQRTRAVINDWSRNKYYESRSIPTRQGNVTEIRYEHALRCVHFPPNGTTIMIGGVNPSDPTLLHNAHQRGGMAGGGMSF